MGMVQHWKRFSKNIQESLKMGQIDICQWCGTNILLGPLPFLHFYSNSCTSVMRKTHMTKINKNCMHTQTTLHLLPKLLTLPWNPPLNSMYISHIFYSSPVFVLKQREESVVISYLHKGLQTSTGLPSLQTKSSIVDFLWWALQLCQSKPQSHKTAFLKASTVSCSKKCPVLFIFVFFDEVMRSENETS